METALMAVQENRKAKQKGEGGDPGRGSWSRKFTAILLVVCMIMIAVGSATCAAATYNTANATMVTFTNSGVTAKGLYSDYEIDGTEFTITGSGTYVFSGSCSDGSIVVKKGLTDVTVVFNGLKLTSTTTAPFNAKNDTEVTLVLAAGTTNSLADTNRDAEKPKACLNSSGDLTITGSGSLTVSGNNKQGIKADGTLTVTGGKLTVSALKKALKADEKVVIGTEGGSDSDLRITFDSDIIYRRDDLRLEDGVFGKKLIQPDQHLMEIKVPGAMPLWLSHILDRLEIRSSAFTKYGNAYKQEITGGQAMKGVYVNA